MEDLENRMVPWRGGDDRKVSTQGKLGIYSSERGWTASSCLSLETSVFAGTQNRKKAGAKYNNCRESPPRLPS
jgi:hypothetical protein